MLSKERVAEKLIEFYKELQGTSDEKKQTTCTCADCSSNDKCDRAFDVYNTNGNCIWENDVFEDEA